VNGAFELALLGVLRNLRPEEIRLEQLFEEEGLRTYIEDRDLGTALNDLALAMDVSDRADRFSATQAFALSVTRRAEGGVERALRHVARRLLEPYIGAAAEDRAEGLVEIADQLSEHNEVTSEVEDGLRIIFGSSLTAAERTNETFGFEGAAAEFVAMLIELLFNRPDCQLEAGTVDVDGTAVDAVLVELQACTGRSFARCSHAIDPRNWKECNRYFFSAVNIIDPQYSNDGWAGKVRETVGPIYNGRKFVTDLSVRCLAQPTVAAVSFDLAPDREPPDDGSVIVDRGFLSVTDEVSHRQIRILKVYRIRDFELPQDWICFLWALQMSQAAWWC
jgi:hypothetical protein